MINNNHGFNAALIYLAAVWSGFTVMSIELLGGRLLAPFFGSSIFVWGGIITVFMLCLSFGYLLGGRISNANPNLGGLGLILVGEGICTLPIILFGDQFLEFFSYLIPDPRYGSLVGSFLLFGIPTILSGILSPYAVRLLVSNLNTAGHSAGKLYFSSTIGSAAGTIITSFYLVMYMEINHIILMNGIISCLLGLSLIFFGFSIKQRRAEHA